jgi:hypothetical protein
MTTTYDVDTLYSLLPATIRARDQSAGQPLHALLAVFAEQIGVVEDNLAQAYADLFIDTCAAWVVPYIGDLVGTSPLVDSTPVVIDTTAPVYEFLVGPNFLIADTLRSRVDVANTIRYRRTKATRPMLEGLSRDVTGWPTYAFEMFQRLRWTQCVRNHLRLDSLGTPDLRSTEALDRLDGPFDPASHGVDVRTPTQSLGWYQVPNVAFFLWRLQSFAVNDVSARRAGAAGDYRYSFSPLGNPTVLFANYDPNAIGTAPPLESQLPAPVRTLALRDDLDAYRLLQPPPGFSTYYGRISEDAPSAENLPVFADAAFTVIRDGDTVPPEQVVAINLSTWCQPQGNVVGVDPKLGRMAFGTTFVPATSVDVYFHQGFSAGIGGGSYPRPAWLTEQSSDVTVIVVDSTGQTGFSTIGAAYASWNSTANPHAIISIVDSRTYTETLNLALPAGARLTIEAVDQERPHVLLSTPLTINGAPDAAVTLSGLLVEGAINVSGPLGTLRLLHATVVPGVSLTGNGLPATTNPSVVVATDNGTINNALNVLISSSITGPLAVPATVNSLYIADSIVDGIGGVAIGSGDASQFAPSTTLLRTTVLGTVSVQVLTEGSESIFQGELTVQRTQLGCLRFSYVPPASTTPSKYRCQPDLEIATELQAAIDAQGGAPLTQVQSDAIRSAVGGRLVPTFTSIHYGDPGYAQLETSGPVQIATGAANGSEMGVFSQLKQPQRTQNLQTRLTEYLPVNLEAVLVDVT